RGRVETAFLQLVMARLWDEEARIGSHGLRLSTLERLGGAERIVRGHVDDALARLIVEDQLVARTVLRYLVTPSGTRIAHTAADLAFFAGRPEADVERVLEAMAATDVRILRPVAAAREEPDVRRYEIF